MVQHLQVARCVGADGHVSHRRWKLDVGKPHEYKEALRSAGLSLDTPTRECRVVGTGHSKLHVLYSSPSYSSQLQHGGRGAHDAHRRSSTCPSRLVFLDGGLGAARRCPR